MTTKQLLSTAWQFDPFVLALVALALALYGFTRRERIGMRAVPFVVASAVFVLALLSPIGVLARGYLFSAHMLQHLLLVLIVPPLGLLALNYDRNTMKSPPRTLRFLMPWLCGVGAMWIWHAPTLCNAASASASVLRFQTVSLVAMGAAFWWPIFGPRSAHRLAPFAGMIYLFTACAACTVLGVLVTFSPVEVCSIYLHPVDRLGALTLLQEGWGLTPSADQQIGGLLMWVPACLVYAGGILALLGRYYREEDVSISASAGAHEVAHVVQAGNDPV